LKIISNREKLAIVEEEKGEDKNKGIEINNLPSDCLDYIDDILNYDSNPTYLDNFMSKPVQKKKVRFEEEKSLTIHQD
jgi:hypothetical protein